MNRYIHRRTVRSPLEALEYLCSVKRETNWTSNWLKWSTDSNRNSATLIYWRIQKIWVSLWALNSSGRSQASTSSTRVLCWRVPPFKSDGLTSILWVTRTPGLNRLTKHCNNFDELFHSIQDSEEFFVQTMSSEWTRHIGRGIVTLSDMQSLW